MKKTSLKVSTPEGYSGRLFSDADDFTYRYHDDALPETAISLTMPVRHEELRRRELHPIFQMNLPEGYLLEQLRNRLAKTVNVDPMLLLALSGSTSPIGRIQVRSETVDALLEDQQFPGENLQEILTWDGTEDIFNDILDRYILRAGISGVQPKVLVPERQNVELLRVTTKTSDLIIKSGRDEYPGLAINEFLCMSMAKEAGIPVPPFYLSDNTKLFVMRRFDRDDLLDPIGFEDMAVLMGLSASQKYSKSYAAIAKAICLFCPPENRRSSLAQLFDSVALSCIVGNGDAHLKNFGLLYSNPTHGDARLAPAYDIVNTTAYIPEDVLALDLAGNKSMFASRQGLLEFAHTCEVERPTERIQRLLASVEAVLERHSQFREEAPDVMRAIEQSSAPFNLSFG
ncbi:type II toxin-antitoxin system HipA family toxin [Pseudomonas sp. SWRI153]|uniref:Type II toxin-antitoxin system HipA family toxin n=1 Tax=Pseudomonas khorasanensis TaxID=2745508 RepID=A0A923JGF2_9PSED|nr:type II toxin-antitoxin system HipA family toxin [Pseudomonas khorasanensis]MBV4488511.1 type II toxin-antitoxin system HipA family toxin [Pseudomonas khorasanensis]